MMHKLLENIEIDFDISLLVNSICENSAVVYVGAGASMSIGLPSWHMFLEECLLRAEQSNPSKHKWQLLNQLLKQGDYLTCAELLQKEIGQSLEGYVWDIFGKADKPSPIHKGIARIPFSLAITSNYDRLLESSYPSSPNVWTWRNPEAIFRSFKQNRFAVIKIHGNVGDGQSLVLTKTQYRDLMHLNKNKAFNDALAILLSIKTFLFVGSSLRDHDLLRLMDDAKLTFSNSFGPHFAILFEDEADKLFIQYLRDEYNIFVILCKRPKIKSKEWRTEAVCSFLKILSGSVSKYSPKAEQFIELDAPNFSMSKMLEKIVLDVAKRTGSERGIVAYIKDLNFQGLFLAKDITVLSYNGGETPTSSNEKIEETIKSKKLLSHETMLGNFFLKGGNRDAYIYSSNILDGKYFPKIPSKNIPSHKSPHSEVKSILACLIHADGQKIGIIALESFSKDAYTKDHLKALQNSAILAGAVYTEYRQRKRSSRGIELFLKDMTTFQELMDMSRQLKSLSISYLLYEIDYEKGVAIARYDPTLVEVDVPIDEFKYYFDEKSLITKVLLERREILIKDAEKDSQKCDFTVSKKGVNFFKIKGPVYGVPIRVEGYTSSVLVAWSREADPKINKLTKRVSRLAHLIANSPDRFKPVKSIEKLKTFTFFKHLNEKLHSVDNGKDWNIERFHNPNFGKKLIQAILQSMTHESCGIARVRLWEFIEKKSQDSYFECIYSYATEEATVYGKKQENEYKGITTSATELYCSYTISRAKQQPFALIQHKSMFGQVDKNYKELDKNPEGKWIVCPIILNNDFMGFISADNHYPANPHLKNEESFIEKEFSEDHQNFQRFCVELNANLLYSILRHKRYKRYERHKRLLVSTQPKKETLEVQVEKEIIIKHHRKKTKEK